MQRASSRSSFGTESSYTEAGRGQIMGCEDCDRKLNFILSEIGSHWKVLNRKMFLKITLAVAERILWMLWDGGKE